MGPVEEQPTSQPEQTLREKLRVEVATALAEAEAPIKARFEDWKNQTGQFSDGGGISARYYPDGDADKTADDFFKGWATGSGVEGWANEVDRKNHIRAAQEIIAQAPEPVSELFFGEGVDDDRSIADRFASFGRLFSGEDRVMISTDKVSGAVGILASPQKGKGLPDAVILSASVRSDCTYTEIGTDYSNRRQIVVMKPSSSSS